MQQWPEEKIEELIDSHTDGMVYFYTPLCGTCQVAGKMLDVAVELFPNISSGKSDLNFMPRLAEQFQIESVPCLILLKEGVPIEKIYAFHSVPFLYEKMKQIASK
ncbi:thioredoxin family protein [Mesobacillus zeae]|uniref:Thioredoxin n=1 Tax=Mesobacillus zeae TaxID=1917180 RepID=A0A398BF05_9BACI|nr:thioredoxin family protein [Mesobacillus zeae]RID86260.1 thioredoxin [Mesobacillus zeae]